LAQIGGKGDDFAAIFNLKPFQDNAGVETARIGKNDFLDAVCHIKVIPKLNFCRATISLGAFGQHPQLPKSKKQELCNGDHMFSQDTTIAAHSA